jgi:Transposase, Mutator family
MHRLVTALTSHSTLTGETAGGHDDTYGSALEAHPGKSQGRPSTNTGSKPTERDRPARPRLPQGAPVPDGRTVLTASDAIRAWGGRWELRQRLRPFIPDTNAIEALNRQLRKALKTKGHFPNEDAARKLIYLAISNAVPAWTRTRNWTTALLAFKIHFGDRLPD